MASPAAAAALAALMLAERTPAAQATPTGAQPLAQPAAGAATSAGMKRQRGIAGMLHDGG